MKASVQDIIQSLDEVLYGQPWYGKAVLTALDSVDPDHAFYKPDPGSHSAIDLLYHMITWTEFTVDRLGKKQMDPEEFEKLDWQKINPETHSWGKGIARFKTANDQIIEVLRSADDSLLEIKVDYRDYNFEHLLSGLIGHHIYHIGQIMYVGKMRKAG